MEEKIYISLQEVEDLIFNKILEIPADRKKVTRAKDKLSIVIVVDSSHYISIKATLTIFFSNVKQFEIPEKEYNLFSVHYRVPEGLITTKDRNVRDIDPNESKLDFGPTEDEKRKADYKSSYLNLRNGLVGLYDVSKGPKFSNENSQECLSLVQNFSSLSNFKKCFIQEVLQEGEYPKLVVKVNEFKADSYFRYVWWGKYVIDYVLEPLKKDLPVEEYELHKKWFKLFANTDDLASINLAIETVPKIYKDELTFMLGYFIGAMKSDAAEVESFGDQLNEYVSYLDNIDQAKVFSWAFFFQALFLRDIGSLYFIRTLSLEILTIEKLAFQFTSLSEVECVSEAELLKIGSLTVEKDEQVKEFFALNNGLKNENPRGVNNANLLDTFENSELSIGNHRYVGFCNDAQHDFDWPNWCSLDKDGFSLNTVNKPKKVKFYYSNSETPSLEYLKDIGISTRPLDKLIKKEKKLLLGFLNDTWSRRPFLSVYSYLALTNTFEKVVMVWMVDKKEEELHSSKFSLERKDFEAKLSAMFGTNVTLILKNIKSPKSRELVRNLKLSIKDYKYKQLEVISDNLSKEVATWILSATDEFYIEDDQKNYYSLLNL